jgi:hypothetical protein
MSGSVYGWKKGFNSEHIAWAAFWIAAAAVLVAIVIAEGGSPECADGLTPVRQDGSTLVCERVIEPPAKSSTQEKNS